MSRVSGIAFKTSRQYLFFSRRIEEFERTVDRFAAATRPEDLQARSLTVLRDSLRGFMEIRCNRWTNIEPFRRLERFQLTMIIEPSFYQTEATLPDGRWLDVLRLARECPHELEVVVTDPQADSRLWAEALNLGVYDLLAQPFYEPEVRRILYNACSRRTYQAYSAAAV